MRRFWLPELRLWVRFAVPPLLLSQIGVETSLVFHKEIHNRFRGLYPNLPALFFFFHIVSSLNRRLTCGFSIYPQDFPRMLKTAVESEI